MSTDLRLDRTNQFEKLEVYSMFSWYYNFIKYVILFQFEVKDLGAQVLYRT